MPPNPTAVLPLTRGTRIGMGSRRRAARSNWFGRAAAHAADQGSGTDTQLDTAFARVEDLQQRVADWIEPFNNAIDYSERVAALDAFYRSNDLRAELSGLIGDAGTAVGEIYGSAQALELALRLEVLDKHLVVDRPGKPRRSRIQLSADHPRWRTTVRRSFFCREAGLGHK